MMRVIPSVMWCGRKRKYRVIRDIVRVNPAESKCRRIESLEDRWRIGPKIALEGDYSDASNIVTEPPAVWPPPRYDSLAKSGLNCAGERISTEDTEPIEDRVIVVRQMSRTG